MNGQQLEEAFFGHFPPEFIEDAIRLIAQEVKSSAAQCYTTFPKEEAYDILGGFRRAGIESKLRQLAESYPEIAAEPVSNKKNGGGNFHTEIRAANSLLTVHKVQYKATPVRKAKFRNSLAERSEASLFSEPSKPITPQQAVLYAVFKYGTDSRMPQALAFAVIDFPNKDGKIVHTMNLLSMDRYSAIPAEFIRFSTLEEIEDNLNLNFRSDAKKKAREDDGGDIAAEQ